MKKYLNNKNGFVVSLAVLIFGLYCIIFPTRLENRVGELIEAREKGYDVNLDQLYIEGAKIEKKQRHLIGFSSIGLGGIFAVGIIGISFLNKRS